MTRITQLTLASSINDEDQLLVRQNGLDKRIYFETIVSAISSGDGLPSQTGNNGKYLTTNGTTASWNTLPSDLPTQTGNSGKFLTTNGTAASWADTPVTSSFENIDVGSAAQLTVDNSGTVNTSGNITAPLFIGNVNGATVNTGNITSDGALTVVPQTTFSNTVIATGGTGVITHSIQSNGTGQMMDYSNFSSIDWQNRLLYNNTGTETIDYHNGYLKNSGVSTVQWQTYYLANGAGQTTVDWSGLLLYDGSGNNSIDWSNRQLFSAGTPVVDWNASTIKDTNGDNSINWEYHTLSSGATGSNLITVNWENRTLRNSSNFTSLDWNSNTLSTAGGTVVVDWENKQLKNTSGTTMVDWSGSTGVSMLLDTSNSSASWDTAQPTTVTEAINRIASYITSGSTAPTIP